MATNKKNGKKFYHPVLDENLAYVTLSKEFIKDIVNLSGSAVKIYLYFQDRLNYEATGCKVEASYGQISKGTGCKDKSTVSSGLVELAERGWLGDVNYQFDGSNIYLINSKANINYQLVQEMMEKRDHMKHAKAGSLESRKNQTNGKIEPHESRKNQTTESRKNQTTDGLENPTLNNNNTNNESKNGKFSNLSSNHRVSSIPSDRGLQKDGFVSREELEKQLGNLFDD